MSNTQTKNVPELRFPGFEGEWEEKKLGDLIKVNSGKDYKHLEKGDIPVYGTGGYMTSVSEPLSEIDAVGIGRKGTINKPYLLEAPFWTVDTLFYCTPKKETDILFILSLFRKINWKVYDESTGVPSLSKQTINKINRFVPSNKEQQKIGEFFIKLDRQIELEEQKLELLQQQKKGYMQKIFSQELRFKDENGNDYPNWEEKKIEDIASQVYGGGTPNTKIKEFWNGDIPWIQSSDVKVNDLILRQCNKFISKNSIELSSAKLIPANSIAIVTRVGVGKLCLVEFDYATSQDFLSLSSLKYDKLYSLYSLLYTMKKISANLQGTSIKGITKKELLDSIIKIPHNLEEQQKIGDLFYKIDKYISFNKCKIEILKSLKQGLLQKIFI
ncbi:restriction endonuclease subunit S [Staphylococcus aureus]|uniref:Type I restriction modification DNA specificity protein n=25 Tax=Staphylococcus TaxID=1279 RepID=A0A7Z7R049_STASC|nr:MULTISPECIES: restriction endonuclease subunit S [Staphylococcus]SUN31840.1 type I restriction modification DNA specificity protein [Staphylococcus schleiferi]HDH6433519.1 restriction endonuclease subunit S [Staphylococcus aureus MRSA-Lux-30]HDK9251342.1 restriction endonuclease subunit S [Staphylococcus aureus USA200-OR-131]AIO21503.1 restriction endonuclease subunit S [Staphylococcus aureus]AIW27510.1 Type I restriction-modification system, specificity subunit S [Staphylococcus aureus]